MPTSFQLDVLVVPTCASARQLCRNYVGTIEAVLYVSSRRLISRRVTYQLVWWAIRTPARAPHVPQPVTNEAISNILISCI